MIEILRSQHAAFLWSEICRLLEDLRLETTIKHCVFLKLLPHVLSHWSHLALCSSRVSN